MAKYSLIVDEVLHMSMVQLHIFSPCIVATTFLECFAVRNSRYQIPCHVPVANLPLVMGIVTLDPIRADLT